MRQRPGIHFIIGAALVALTFGCDDGNSGSDEGAGGIAGGAGGSANGEGSGSGGEGSGAGGEGNGAGGGDTGAGDNDTGAELAPEFAFLVRGSMAADDEAAAGAAHDAVAGGGEAAAREAGDYGHDAFLATEHLGYVPDGIEFLGLDRWDDIEAAAGFYSNPMVAEGFASLFTAEPSVTPFVRAWDWHGWGDLDSGDDGERWWVMVRGRLGDDPANIQTAHDQIAAGGEEAATMLGDIAHVVYLGAEDPREFLAVDVWTDDSKIGTFYGDPDFQAAFATLFDGPPEVVVYRSTTWHQW